MRPLTDGAWPNVSLSAEMWSDWMPECGGSMMLRRWVPGPNGPSFLTEYTPADDYITEGRSGQHDTFNGLYRDEDREFYVPRPEDLHVLKRVFPQADCGEPSWNGIRAALCAAGHADAELAGAKAPVLIALLGQANDYGGGAHHESTTGSLSSEYSPRPDAAGSDGSSSADAMDEQFGGPEEDPFDSRVVRWVGKRLYLGPEGSQVRELFMLLARKPGVAHSLGDVQLAVDGMGTYRDRHGEEPSASP